MDDTIKQQLSAAREVMAVLRPAFDAGVAALAHACASDGRLVNRLLDAQQVASFELAWAGAELLAVETSVAAVMPDSAQLQTQLAMVFAVESVISVFDRLETVYAESSLDPAPLRAVRDGVA
jgi:(2S)-methylsuccinyl-CoA dehydrogenase